MTNRIVSCCVALVLVVGGTGIAATARADDGVSPPASAVPVSPAQDSPAQDLPAPAPPAPDPPAPNPGDHGDQGKSASPAASSSSASSATSVSPAASSSPVPSASSAAPSPAPPPTSTVRDGILRLRGVDVSTGAELVDIPARVFEAQPHDTRMPAEMLLPAGRYRVELLAVPGGYRLVSAWTVYTDVPAQASGEVIFQFTPVAVGPHGRTPIRSIPSGRTQ